MPTKREEAAVQSVQRQNRRSVTFANTVRATLFHAPRGRTPGEEREDEQLVVTVGGTVESQDTGRLVLGACGYVHDAGFMMRRII